MGRLSVKLHYRTVYMGKYNNKWLVVFTTGALFCFLKHLASLHSCEIGSNLSYSCPIVIAFGLMKTYSTRCSSIRTFASSCLRPPASTFKAEVLPPRGLPTILNHAKLAPFHRSVKKITFIYDDEILNPEGSVTSPLIGVAVHILIFFLKEKT